MVSVSQVAIFALFPIKNRDRLSEIFNVPDKSGQIVRSTVNVWAVNLR